LKLFVTYALPTSDDTAKRDKAKDLFALILQEFRGSEYENVLEGYLIPSPLSPTSDMSNKELQDYFSLVNELSNLAKGEIHPKSMFCGFPIDPRDASVVVFNPS